MAWVFQVACQWSGRRESLFEVLLLMCSHSQTFFKRLKSANAPPGARLEQNRTGSSCLTLRSHTLIVTHFDSVFIKSVAVGEDGVDQGLDILSVPWAATEGLLIRSPFSGDAVARSQQLARMQTESYPWGQSLAPCYFIDFHRYRVSPLKKHLLDFSWLLSHRFS